MKAAAVLVLSAVMVCTAACGSGGSSSGGSSQDTAAAGTLLIGGIGPLTGDASVYGQSVRNGAQLAVDTINGKGGVSGIRLQLDFKDDENKPENAVSCYNSLKSEGMKLLLGPATSQSCLSVEEQSYIDSLFQIVPTATADECTRNENVFRICASSTKIGTAAVRYIVSKSIGKKAAVIYDSSSEYSSGLYDTFRSEASAEGLDIVETQTFTSDNRTDFSVQIQKIRESGADILFLPILSKEAALILKQSGASSLSGMKVIGCDGIDSLVDELGSDSKLAEGVCLISSFCANGTDDKTVSFVKAYKAAYNDAVPNQYAADAYDAVLTIRAVLEASDIKSADIDAANLCSKLKDSMTMISVDGLTGTLKWSVNGDVDNDPRIMVIKDGVCSTIS